MVFVYRYSRETSLFTDNLEFYLKQRTVSHNQDKAKLAIYKTKLEKLERELDQWKNRGEDQLSQANKLHEQELAQVQNLSNEIADLKVQNQDLLNEKQHLVEQNQDLQNRLEAESLKFSGLMKANQGLQSRLDKVKGQIRLVESQKDEAEAKVLHLAQKTKVQEVDSSQRSTLRESNSFLKHDEHAELQQLRLREQVAQRFEDLLKEKAQKDYNAILSLEKEIIHLRLKFEGQSLAYQSTEQQGFDVLGLNSQAETYKFAKQDLSAVQNEVTAIRSVVLNDIKPQMNQYMHELQGLAQRLRETRQSFFDNQLSRRAFESLSVEDVA